MSLRPVYFAAFVAVLAVAPTLAMAQNEFPNAYSGHAPQAPNPYFDGRSASYTPVSGNLDRYPPDVVIQGADRVMNELNDALADTSLSDRQRQILMSRKRDVQRIIDAQKRRRLEMH